MDMKEIVKLLGKEVSQKRENEQRILNEIAVVTSLDFAHRAADTLNPREHLYSFESYLSLLGCLKELLCAGMTGDLALESVQSGFDAQTILAIWELSKA